jgi:hypothetical protein
MTAEFQEFRIIGFALYTMTYAPAYYQDVDDVLDLSYVPNTSEDIDVNDLLDLSYVPSTAEDIILFEEKQSICTRRYKPPAERKVLSSIKVPMEASQVVTQGSLNAILIERLIFVASTTMRSPLPFLLSLLELLRDLNRGISFF